MGRPSAILRLMFERVGRRRARDRDNYVDFLRGRNLCALPVSIKIQHCNPDDDVDGDFIGLPLINETLPYLYKQKAMFHLPRIYKFQ